MTRQEGYLQEIFSSFQGEGAALDGSCYGLRQIFVRFAGCPLALGVHGTKGCIWCDSPQAQREKVEICKVETQAGSQKFRDKKNPFSPEKVVKIINNLKTPDLHSISFTGGEPLHQPIFLQSLLESAKKEGLCTYLETAYTDNLKFLMKISPYIDQACVDIKDRSAQASIKWKKLVEQEVKMCKTMIDGGTKVFSKVVISKSSNKKDFEFISSLCGKYGIPIAIQLVSSNNKGQINPPSWEKIQKFTEIAANHLPPKKIGISAQVHKLINIL